jgi:hypothetical protein
MFIGFLILSACATPAPRWEKESMALLDQLRQEDGERMFRAEFRSAEDVLIKGEALLHDFEFEQAENCFRLSYLKLSLLEQNLAAEKNRLKLEQQKRRTEAERLANERIKAHEKELREAEERKALESAKIAMELQYQKALEKSKAGKERGFVSSYTVSRGETLPLIAAHPEVYGDRNLWPLIYRANRDQIGDPRHIWPGQVLRIKRNQSREEIIEARRFAQEKAIH